MKNIEDNYEQYAKEMLPNYLAAFSGKRSLLKRALNKLSGYRLHKLFVEHKYKRYEKIAIRNYIECEAHRELVIKGIRSATGFGKNDVT